MKKIFIFIFISIFMLGGTLAFADVMAAMASSLTISGKLQYGVWFGNGDVYDPDTSGTRQRRQNSYDEEYDVKLTFDVDRLQQWFYNDAR